MKVDLVNKINFFSVSYSTQSSLHPIEWKSTHTQRLPHHDCVQCSFGFLINGSEVHNPFILLMSKYEDWIYKNLKR